MSRTKRIYNKRLKKAQRTNIDDNNVHVIIGIPLTRRSSICVTIPALEMRGMNETLVTTPAGVA